MAVEAAERLEKEGKKARVVSMIGWELFEQQPQSYKASAASPTPVHAQTNSRICW